MNKRWLDFRINQVNPFLFFFICLSKSANLNHSSFKFFNLPFQYLNSCNSHYSSKILSYIPFQTIMIVLYACVTCLGTKTQNWNVDTSSIVYVLIPGFRQIEHALCVENCSILTKSILNCKEEGPTKWFSRSFQLGIKGVKESFTHYLSS